MIWIHNSVISFLIYWTTDAYFSPVSEANCPLQYKRLWMNMMKTESQIASRSEFDPTQPDGPMSNLYYLGHASIILLSKRVEMTSQYKRYNVIPINVYPVR